MQLGLLQRCACALDGRLQTILARRSYAEQPETLNEPGRALGLTRERVRQVEARARAEMAKALAPGGVLGIFSAAVRELVDTVLPLADLITFMPVLARQVEAVGQPAWRVLGRLDASYQIEDSWCAAPTILAARAETRTRLLELADSRGVVRIDHLGPLNRNQSEKAARASLRDWLIYCGCVIDADYVFTRTETGE